MGYRLKRWEKINHANTNQNKGGIALLLTSDKRDFRVRNIARDKEEPYLIIKRSIQADILNVYFLQPQSFKTPETKTDTSERRNTQTHDYS